MIDVFYYYVSTLSFLCVISGLLCVYRYFLGNRLTAQAQKLKSQLATIKQWYPEIEQNRGNIVAKGLGDIGIDGIMSELGIDPKLLSNPLVKGLIDKYAPRLIEQLSKGKNAVNNQSEEIRLL